MNILYPVLYTFFLATVLIQEIVQIQKNQNSAYNPLASDNFQFHVIDVNILVLDIVIVIKISLLIELHHIQMILNITTNAKRPEARSPYYLSQKVPLSFFF